MWRRALALRVSEDGSEVASGFSRKMMAAGLFRLKAEAT